MKVAIFLFISLCPTFVFSNSSDDRWIYFYESKHDYFYYDTESIVSDGNKIKVWTKWISKKEVDIDPEGNLQLDYVMNQYIYNCASREFVWLQQVLVRKNGTSRAVDFEYNTFESIVPNSEEEVLFNKICK